MCIGKYYNSSVGLTKIKLIWQAYEMQKHSLNILIKE